MKAKLWGAYATQPVILRALAEWLGLSTDGAFLILEQALLGKQDALDLLADCGIEIEPKNV